MIVNTLLLNIILRSIALIIFCIGVLPIMFKEALVKDYLRVLRIMIPIATVVYLLIGLVVVYTNFCELFFCISPSAVNGFGVFNSFASVVIAIVMYLIYHRKY